MTDSSGRSIPSRRIERSTRDNPDAPPQACTEETGRCSCCEGEGFGAELNWVVRDLGLAVEKGEERV